MKANIFFGKDIRVAHHENLEVLKVGMKRYLDEVVKPAMVKMLDEVAERMVNAIDTGFERNDKNYPVDTGNMHDATGVGVYADGKLEGYYPTKFATDPKTDELGYEYWGIDLLEDALNAATTTFSHGFWIVLFSNIWHAIEVDAYGSPWQRGKGFFSDKLASVFLAYLQEGLDKYFDNPPRIEAYIIRQ